MKEFKCKSCNKIWFVKLDMADEVAGCPFCLKELPKPRVIVVDSFENAVLKVIVDYGVEIVSDRRKFLSYLTDVAFDYRKEIKILSNACDSKVFAQFYELSSCKFDDAKLKIRQIQQHLVDEEGIAEAWAKRICECFICAIREDYVRGKQPTPARKKQPTVEKIITQPVVESTHVTGPVNTQVVSQVASCVISIPERSKVQTIYQSEISKKVSQPNFPNWFNKKKAKRISFYELIIPNSMQSINEGQFQNNKSFDWLIVGNGLKEIPKRAFQNISAEFVYLSDGVEKICDYAFADSNIKCVIIANHSNITISDTAFLRTNNVKLVFEHEWFSTIVKHCDSHKIAHAGLGPMEEYFAEYAKIKLEEKETN